MATWITSKTGGVVNLDHFAQIFIRANAGAYSVVGMAPGLAVSSEGEEHYDETNFFSGTKEACENALATIKRLLNPTTLD